MGDAVIVHIENIAYEKSQFMNDFAKKLFIKN